MPYPPVCWVAGWTGAPPQVSPAAPPTPNCIGPAAPKGLVPDCTPGRSDWPLPLSASSAAVPWPPAPADAGEQHADHQHRADDEQVVAEDRIQPDALGDQGTALAR